MKKLFAAVLALALVLSMVCVACAEVRTYTMTGMMDNEGNAYELAEGMTAVTLTIDDEAMTVIADNGESTMNGTLTIEAGDEGVLIFTLTMEDGSEMGLMYDVEGDYFLMVDEEGTLLIVLENVEALTAEEPAA